MVSQYFMRTDNYDASSSYLKELFKHSLAQGVQSDLL